MYQFAMSDAMLLFSLMGTLFGVDSNSVAMT